MIVPFTVAALLMAVGKHLPRRVLDVLAITTTTTVAVLCALLLARSLDAPLVYWFGGWQPRDGIALGIAFVIDPIGAALALLAALLVLAGFVYSWRYFNEVGPLYPALMLTFLGAMAGFALTGDLFNLFVFFELMSVAAYALTATKIEEEESLMGAFNFAVSNSVGSFLVLTGIALIYGRTGALNLAQIGAALAGPARRWSGDRGVGVDRFRLFGQGGAGAVSLLAGRCPRRRADAGVRAVLRRHGRVGPVRGAARATGPPSPDRWRAHENGAATAAVDRRHAERGPRRRHVLRPAPSQALARFLDGQPHGACS